MTHVNNTNATATTSTAVATGKETGKTMPKLKCKNGYQTIQGNIACRNNSDGPCDFDGQDTTSCRRFGHDPKGKSLEVLTALNILARKEALDKNGAIRKYQDGWHTRSDEVSVRYGVLAREIAEAMGIPQIQARYHLKKLEKLGLVLCHSHPGYSSLWWPVGLTKELKKEASL